MKSFTTPFWHGEVRIKPTSVKTKQNHSIRFIFFARTSLDQTDSALPLLNVLGILKLNNVYRLQALKFMHSWHRGLLPRLFHDFFQYASEVHGYYTRHASRQNLCISKVRTNNFLNNGYSLGQYPYSSLGVPETLENLFIV